MIDFMDFSKIKSKDTFSNLLKQIDFHTKEEIARYIEKDVKNNGLFGYPNSSFTLTYPSNWFYYTVVYFGNADKVLIIIKRFKKGKVSTVRLLGFPISMKMNDSHVHAVIHHLISNKLVDDVFMTIRHTKYFKDNYGIDKLYVGRQEYYYDVTERYNHFNKAKFRSKNKINLLRKDSNFNFRELHLNDALSILDVDKAWLQHKKDLGWPPSYIDEIKKLLRHLKTIPKENYRIFGIFYLGYLVCFEVYLHFFGNTFFVNSYRTIANSKWAKYIVNRHKDQNQKMFNHVIKKSGQINAFFTLELLTKATPKTEFIFIGPSSRKGLTKHKKSMATDRFDWYISERLTEEKELVPNTKKLSLFFK